MPEGTPPAPQKISEANWAKPKSREGLRAAWKVVMRLDAGEKITPPEVKLHATETIISGLGGDPLKLKKEQLVRLKNTFLADKEAQNTVENLLTAMEKQGPGVLLESAKGGKNILPAVSIAEEQVKTAQENRVIEAKRRVNSLLVETLGNEVYKKVFQTKSPIPAAASTPGEATTS